MQKTAYEMVVCDWRSDVCSSDLGASLTEDDIVSDLQMAGVRHGIRKKAIEHFLQNHADRKSVV